MTRGSLSGDTGGDSSVVVRASPRDCASIGSVHRTTRCSEASIVPRKEETVRDSSGEKPHTKSARGPNGAPSFWSILLNSPWLMVPDRYSLLCKNFHIRKNSRMASKPAGKLILSLPPGLCFPSRPAGPEVCRAIKVRQGVNRLHVEGRGRSRLPGPDRSRVPTACEHALRQEQKG